MDFVATFARMWVTTSTKSHALASVATENHSFSPLQE